MIKPTQRRQIAATLHSLKPIGGEMLKKWYVAVMETADMLTLDHRKFNRALFYKQCDYFN
mgnify:CR=1 FL=1